ncbi:pyridoxamine 5'-phosphate oxidase family protein [Phytoactinopolyspora mesophila]|uniref:Pyridoxamine 5'-phosphate oxidase family protein n=1 Tax=Phytoactinopolyspora mesophila TaxID=2650750 RepID=A0A7K3M766_9ACTN|nr:pyridoxamine 5'-phosphate oxidase family protein [Phytoactinopolyspora mesophila]NDL59126.1 pyridoxamine 5'-phosphate oxidase family protein [Phytoactinopolyspora mesophila]
MFTHPKTGMTVLSEGECWELLGGAHVARLAAVVGDELEVFPINVVVDGHTVVFRTAEGTKLAAATMARQVVIEADDHDRGTGLAWSVVLKGVAERVDDFNRIYQLEELALVPWDERPKQWFVQVTPRQISGRRFAAAV